MVIVLRVVGAKTLACSSLTPSSMGDKNERKLTDEIARLRKYMETTTLAKSITNAIKMCNLLFHDLTDVPTLLREDIEAISTLHQPCSDENDFRVKLGALAELFQVDAKKWEPILEKFDPNLKRASTLLTRWLDEQEIPYDRDEVKVWDAIIDLRNVSFPYHPTNKKLIPLVKAFGQSFPINYMGLYESVLKKFLESLKMLQRVLFNASLRHKRQGERNCMCAHDLYHR